MVINTTRSTTRADAIRGEEYQHLDRHVCLDYTAINLFSHQLVLHRPSLTSRISPRGDTAAATGSGIGAAVTRRIMVSLKIPDDEYAMVCTANRTTAFRLLAESYSFQPGKQLLPVYDYESEAVAAMADSARRRGAEVISASFAWPSMRIHSTDLRKRLARGRRRGGGRGLFVFPLASRMTGARYPYLWMTGELGAAAVKGTGGRVVGGDTGVNDGRDSEEGRWTRLAQEFQYLRTNF